MLTIGGILENSSAFFRSFMTPPSRVAGSGGREMAWGSERLDIDEEDGESRCCTTTAKDIGAESCFRTPLSTSFMFEAEDMMSGTMFQEGLL